MIYFAYGSNLDVEQMRLRCPGHRVLGRAYLPGYRLCFPRRSPVRRCGTAGIEVCIGEGVWGALYELTSEDRARLHAREGYFPDDAKSSRHTVMDVHVLRGSPEGESVKAFTYVAIADGSCVPPSPDYMGHLIRGARHHGLPELYIAFLERQPTEAAA